MIRSVWRSRLSGAALLLVAPGALPAQGGVITGTLTAVWGDPHPASTDAAALRWALTDDRGRAVAVDMSADAVRRAGGIRALDRRRVAVRGVLDRQTEARGRARPVLRATGLRIVDEPPTAGSHAPPQLGSRPYVALLCTFADLPAEPRPPSFFETLLGDGYPNMTHYYREASDGRIDLTGTRVFGWFTLPRGHDRYFDSETGSALLYDVADDCIAAANPVVDFAAFAGIIIQVNGQFSRTGYGLAWGGSRVLALDGPARVWPFMWMPLWATDQSRYGIYAHELGHSLGLPHSAGRYEYDSAWDVMSRPYLRWDGTFNAWVPGGTIAFHKDLLGWIEEDRKVTVRGTSEIEVRLDPHTAGSEGDGIRFVRIPIPGTPDFYTVEARRRSGYDQALPGDAVIVHRVPDPDGPHCTLSRCAELMEGHPGPGHSGAGAMWRQGETFDDGVVRVSVTGATATGWELTVTVGGPPTPSALTVTRAAEALFQGGMLSDEEREYLDTMGNRNGRYDLGDFLAYLRRQDQ
jgi:M6 family metalloprotease-like protein